MDTAEIKNKLYSMRDEKYSGFSAKLIPGFEKEYFIGVRTPLLKAFAREIVRTKNYEDFLKSLPHETLEENLLHAFIVANEKHSIDATIKRVEEFLPYINNWAVCDQFSIKIFGKHHNTIYPYIRKWITSKHLYTRRFAIVNSMRFFLDEKFNAEIPKDVADATTDEYYVQMAIAWYFATALAKQWSATIHFIEQRKLPDAVHKMTIRKALESFRISQERKSYLKDL